MSIVNDQDIAALCTLAPPFGQIIELYGPPPPWSRPPGFVSLVKLILEQQVSIDSARAAYLKLEHGLGSVDPSSIVRLSTEDWRTYHVSRQKARYIKLLACAVEDGTIDLDGLSLLTDDAVYHQLLQLTGVGPWTANVYLLFCLQREDIWPKGDIALINTTIKLFDVGRDAVNDLSQEWSPYRSLATFCQWHYYLCKRGRSAVY